MPEVLVVVRRHSTPQQSSDCQKTSDGQLSAIKLLVMLETTMGIMITSVVALAHLLPTRGSCPEQHTSHKNTTALFVNISAAFRDCFFRNPATTRATRSKKTAHHDRKAYPRAA